MLYIIRHGKTDWNAQKRLQGHTDIPLNAEGREMARAARSACASISFDVCFCSPLIRARETAEILLEGRNVPIVPDERLTEMDFGAYDGRCFADAEKGSPLDLLFHDPLNYAAVEDGESFDALCERTGEFLTEVVEPVLREGGCVLIAGHGAVNASIIGRIRGIPRERFWDALTGNCKLTKLL